MQPAATHERSVRPQDTRPAPRPAGLGVKIQSYFPKEMSTFFVLVALSVAFLVRALLKVRHAVAGVECPRIRL